MRQYMDKAAAAEELQVRNTFIATVFKEIHKLVGSLLTDYMHYREALNDKDMAKYVPEFDVRAAEIELGIGHTQVVMVDAQKVADIICAKMAAAIGGMK